MHLCNAQLVRTTYKHGDISTDDWQCPIVVLFIVAALFPVASTFESISPPKELEESLEANSVIFIKALLEPINVGADISD